jgi:hypothetical protein
MFTLVAAMLTMLIALFEMNPTVANKGAGMGFTFAPLLNQSARNSCD